MVVAHGLSCSAACGIFLDQGLSSCPLHWQAESYTYATREVLLWIIEPKFISDSPDQGTVGSRKESTFWVGLSKTFPVLSLKVLGSPSRVGHPSLERDIQDRKLQEGRSFVPLLTVHANEGWNSSLIKIFIMMESMGVPEQRPFPLYPFLWRLRGKAWDKSQIPGSIIPLASLVHKEVFLQLYYLSRTPRKLLQFLSILAKHKSLGTDLEVTLSQRGL